MLFAVLSLGTLIHLSKAPRLTALTFTAELGTQFSVPLYLAVRAVPSKPSLASAYVLLRARLCKKKNVVHVPRGILAPSAFLSFKKNKNPQLQIQKCRLKTHTNLAGCLVHTRVFLRSVNWMESCVVSLKIAAETDT